MNVNIISPSAYTWVVILLATICSFGVLFCSSGYIGNVQGNIIQVGVSTMVALLGVSLFYALLPEVIDRCVLFIIAYGAMTAFNTGVTWSQNIETLLIMRFLAGTFGSSLLINASLLLNLAFHNAITRRPLQAGGTLADIFMANQCAIIITLLVEAIFMGQSIVAGFVGDNSGGWRWFQEIMTILTGIIFIVDVLFYPETYAPILIQTRAKKLPFSTGGAIYQSKFETQMTVLFMEHLKTSPPHS
ncbi:unnamed protein product [Rotaria magnacalcarata]|uniref:Uncharacterized protein n=1 Tax=Rotaria magnacalcarata TaxID=392030 RepID=A0A816LLJ3_9BILA|nr:unnamed protein product [Rotaria magnacalcarata]